jgi:hypothetical protein
MDRIHSKEIKKRFVECVELITKELYPDKREIDIIKEIGFAPTNYYRMRLPENNNYPTLDNCYLLCNKYSISANYLLLGKKPIKQAEVKNKSIADSLRDIIIEIEKKGANAPTRKNK